MPRDPECIVCHAGRPNLQAICTECDGCMVEHCQCDPCQHDKARIDECVFCERNATVVESLLDAVVRADDIEADLRWLMGESNV